MLLNHHAVIIGNTQTGKTCTALALGQFAIKNNRIVIFVNTKGETRVTLACKYRNVTPEVFAYILKNHLCDGMVEIKIGIREMDPLALIEDFLNILLDFKDKDLFPVLLIVDEMHRFQSKASIDSMFKNIWLQGLGLQLFAISISQRASQIHNDIISQSDYKFLHAQDQRDLKYLQENRYLTIPDNWLLPLDDPNSKYPFLASGNQINHRLFYLGPGMLQLQEIPLKTPPKT